MKETIIMNSERILSITSSLANIEFAVRNVRDELIYLNREAKTAQDAHASALIAAENVPMLSLAGHVNTMLSGEYALRSMQAVCDQTGASRDDIVDALAENSIDLVFRRRGHDGAELVGLATRN